MIVALCPIDASIVTQTKRERDHEFVTIVHNIVIVVALHNGMVVAIAIPMPTFALPCVRCISDLRQPHR